MWATSTWMGKFLSTRVHRRVCAVSKHAPAHACVYSSAFINTKRRGFFLKSSPLPSCKHVHIWARVKTDKGERGVVRMRVACFFFGGGRFCSCFCFLGFFLSVTYPALRSVRVLHVIGCPKITSVLLLLLLLLLLLCVCVCVYVCEEGCYVDVWKEKTKKKYF